MVDSKLPKNKKVSQSVISNDKFPGQLRLRIDHLNTAFQSQIAAYHESAWALAHTMPFPDKEEESWRRIDLEGLTFDQLRPTGLSSNNSKAVTPATTTHFPELTSTAGWLRVTPDSVTGYTNPVFKHMDFVFSDFQTAEQEHPERVAQLAGKVIPAADGKFAAMASALGMDGCFLFLGKNVQIDAPFIAELKTGPAMSANFSHTIIWLEEGASGTILLTFSDEKPDNDVQSYHNGLLEVHLGKGAQLTLVELQEFGAQTWDMCHERAEVAQDAKIDWIHGNLGARVSKHFVEINLVNLMAQARLKGFYFTGSGQYCDLHTQQNHLAAHTISDLLFKGAVSGNSKAVWQGMIYVDPTAMGADGYQSSRNLVLSESAEVNAIPGLEILADDVRCSHGATVGSLDVDELFYLQTRGIPAAEAEQLLVEGFFAGIVEAIPVQSVQDAVKMQLRQKLIDSLE